VLVFIHLDLEMIDVFAWVGNREKGKGLNMIKKLNA